MVVVFALFGGDPGEVAFVVVVVSGVAQLVFRRVFEDHAGRSLQVVDGDVLLTAPGVFDGSGGKPAVVDVAEGPFAGDDHGDEPVVFVVDVTIGFAFGACVAVFQAVGPVAVAGGFFEVAGVDADAFQLVEVVVAAGLAQFPDVGGGVVAVAPRGLAVAGVLVVVVVVVVDHFHRVGVVFVAIQCCPDQPVGGIVVVFCFFFSGVDDLAPVAVGIVVVAALCGAGLFDFCLQAVVFVVTVAGLPPLWVFDLQQVVAVVVTVGGFALVGVYAADQAVVSVVGVACLLLVGIGLAEEVAGDVVLVTPVVLAVVGLLLVADEAVAVAVAERFFVARVVDAGKLVFLVVVAGFMAFAIGGFAQPSLFVVLAVVGGGCRRR